MADNMEACILKCTEVFFIPELLPEQKEALISFVKKKDVFLNLPTGYGKSLVYQMTPLLHSELAKLNDNFTAHPILIVVSPLKSLMEDQINYLRSLGIKAGAIGENEEENKRISKGELTIVYTSPESLLGNSKWRSMLLTRHYQESLVGIVVDEAHCISQWGTSKSQNAVAFRRWFYKLSELRSLVPNSVPFMAVTATATIRTKSSIIDVLRLKDFMEIQQSPNKDNLAFHVIYMDKKHSLLDYFTWLLEELKEKKDVADRTILYCQTIKQCSDLYTVFLKELGKEFVIDQENCSRRRVEMLHSLSPKSVKKSVLEDLCQEDGCIKVLVCTIAFGMGINCNGVHTIIHFGPSKSVEAYIQESGRAGRDGKPSNCIILYKALMLIHVEKDMRDYVRGKCECRRKCLMQSFELTSSTCGSESQCDKCNTNSTKFVPTLNKKKVYDGPTRKIDTNQMAELKSCLIIFRKKMYAELIKQTLHGTLPVFTIPDLILGFSDNQINQVIANCDKLFTLSDVYRFVEIWKKRHAISILRIVKQVFRDINVVDDDDDDEDYLSRVDNTGFEEIDDEDMWKIIIPREELMDVDWSELSYSGLFPEDMSVLEDSVNLSDESHNIPEAIAELIDNIQID